MTKSPLLVAQEALRVARRSLPEDASGFSRRDYTRHQLVALLVLRKFFRTALRGIVVMVREWSDLQKVLQRRCCN